MNIKYCTLFTVLLVTTFTAAGCHSPSLSSLHPTSPKVAVGIIGSSEFTNSKEIKEYTNKVLQEKGVVLDLQPVDNAQKAVQTLSSMAASEQLDLIITDSLYSEQVGELAKAHSAAKFGVAGTAMGTVQPNLRVDSINREHQSFVAGYLIASGIPQDQLGVIVKTYRTSQSAEWKGLLEGIHYAGMSADPLVLTLDEIMAQDGIEKMKSKKPRVLILLDPVNEAQLARLHESGKWLFSLHDVPKVYPSVIARPAPVLLEGVQEQIQALLNNSWSGNSQSVMGSTYFELLKPDAVAGIAERKKSAEDALRSGTLLPDRFSNPPKPDKST